MRRLGGRPTYVVRLNFGVSVRVGRHLLVDREYVSFRVTRNAVTVAYVDGWAEVVDRHFTRVAEVNVNREACPLMFAISGEVPSHDTVDVNEHYETPELWRVATRVSAIVKRRVAQLVMDFITSHVDLHGL